MAGRERVAFLGLGIMGAPMAANLVRAGFEVTVWNRTHARAERFVAQHGGHMANTPARAAETADVLVTMVVDAPEVESVLFGVRDSAFDSMREGTLAIDMSTIAPSASVRVGERLRAGGVGFLDAPVSGSRPRAEAGTLTIMAGGTESDFERGLPVLQALGELVVHVGPQGHGSMVKLINNTLAAVNAAALAEALVLAGKAELDTGALRQVVAAGSGASAMLDLKAEPMLEHDFQPLFKLEHMLKDVRHCLAEAQRLGGAMPMAAKAETIYSLADHEGHGADDFAAIVTALESHSSAPPT